MPYIRRELREPIDKVVAEIIHQKLSDGEMNYLFTTLLLSRYTRGGYSDLQSAAGLLLMVFAEFYRRVAAPYEDRKKDENGDVY